MRELALALPLAVGVLLQHTAAGAAETAIPFPVPASPIRSGETISDGMLAERNLVANAVAQRSYATSREALVGKVARRALPAGAAVPLSAVREPYAVSEGQRVTLEYRDAGLSIQCAGVALQAGAPGQEIRVRNVETGLVVSGLVRPNGSIAVGGR